MTIIGIHANLNTSFKKTKTFEKAVHKKFRAHEQGNYEICRAVHIQGIVRNRYLNNSTHLKYVPDKLRRKVWPAHFKDLLPVFGYALS